MYLIYKGDEPFCCVNFISFNNCHFAWHFPIINIHSQRFIQAFSVYSTIAA